MSEPSDFGRGCLVCLLAFLDHKSQIGHYFAQPNPGKLPPPWAFLITDPGRSWANGASDHLAELEVPPSLAGTPIAGALEAFRDRWMAIGHGGPPFLAATLEEIQMALLEAERLALDVAAELDRLLGLTTATTGTYT